MLPEEFAKQAYSYINKKVTLVIRVDYPSDNDPAEETIDSGELLYVQMANSYLSYRFRGTKDDITREISLHGSYNRRIKDPADPKSKNTITMAVQRIIDIECSVLEEI